MVFLQDMPKGGDLHNHVSRAVYSENMLDAAVRKALFFDPATLQFGTDATKIPAANVLNDDALRYRFLNAASMRGWMGGGQSGHDHFFATFGIFGAALDAMAEAAVANEAIGRAKRQHLQYAELMFGPVPYEASAEYYQNIPSSTDMVAALETLRPRLAKLLPAVKTYLDLRDTFATGIGQHSYTSADEPMTARWIYSVNRLSSDDGFFASAAAGIFLAANEPRIAAMNILAPRTPRPPAPTSTRRCA
ncbi:hypothetical protein BH11ARM2_BH11ARM2_36550 [soil metagenome]